MKYKVTIKLESHLDAYDLMMSLAANVENLLYIDVEDEDGEITGYGEACEDTEL